MSPRSLLVLALLLVASACTLFADERPCSSDADCPVVELCSAGFCAARPGQPTIDAGATPDAGEFAIDGGALDGGAPDASVDAGAAVDAGPTDAGLDDGGLVDAGFFGQWERATTLLIDGSRLDAAIFDLPIGFRLNEDHVDFDAPNAASSIRFVHEDGSVLSHEVDYFDTIDRDALVWVKLTLPARSARTEVTLYTGNPNAPNLEDPDAVFSNGYDAVYHLGPDGLADTFGGPDLLPSVAGVVDGDSGLGTGLSLSSQGTISLPQYQGSAFADQVRTLTFFLDADAAANGQSARIFGSPGTVGTEFNLRTQTDDSIQFRIIENGAVDSAVNGNVFGGPIISNGCGFSYSLDDVQFDCRGYGRRTPDAFLPITQVATFGEAFSGTIDEIRVASVTRSRAYLGFELRGMERTILVPKPPPPPPAPPHPSPRTPGPVVLYDFDGNVPNFFEDTGTGTPLPAATKSAFVERIPGGIWVTGEAHIASAVATKVTDAVRSSGELSAEVWFVPQFEHIEGPPRLFALSDSISVQSFIIGQEGRGIDTRLRAEPASAPPDSPDDAFELGAMTHVVLRRDASVTTLFVNGAIVASTLSGGALDVWSDDAMMTLANDIDDPDEHDDRTWLGALYLAAVYDRALSDEEVAANFAAGP